MKIGSDASFACPNFNFFFTLFYMLCFECSASCRMRETLLGIQAVYLQWWCLSRVCRRVCCPRGRLETTVLCASLCLRIWFGHLHRCLTFPSQTPRFSHDVCPSDFFLFLGCSPFTFSVVNWFRPFTSTRWCAGLFPSHKLVSACVVAYLSCIQVSFCTRAKFRLKLLLTKNKTAYTNGAVITLFNWLPNTRRGNSEKLTLSSFASAMCDVGSRSAFLPARIRNRDCFLLFLYPLLHHHAIAEFISTT